MVASWKCAKTTTGKPYYWGYQEVLGVTKADCFLNNKSMLTRLEGCTFKDWFCVLGTFLALLEKFKKNMVDENNIKFNEIRVISLSISISFNLQKWKAIVIVVIGL